MARSKEGKGGLMMKKNNPYAALKIWGMIFIILISLCSCSALYPDKLNAGVAPSRCLPDFPDKDGWYGGDGAYSIPLDSRRTLWLFGDTFVACPGWRSDRLDMDVVLGTTLGISTCSRDNEFKIKYYLEHKDGKFVSSFSGEEWLWPQDPFIVNNVLYIPLIAVAPANQKGEVFNFKVAGHKFVRVRDFSAEDPRAWHYDFVDLTSSLPMEISAFATTSVVHDGYVYFYPFYVRLKEKPHIFGNILARIPANQIDHPQDAIEYFTRDGRWERTLEPENIKVVLDAGVSELSVRYHDACRKWVAVYLTVRNKGNQLLYQTADRPEGPWSVPKVLEVRIPELDPQSPFYDKGNFCYAGKEHIEFSRDKNLVVTYVCNSSEDMESQTSFIRRSLFLYRPVVREAAYE